MYFVGVDCVQHVMMYCVGVFFVIHCGIQYNYEIVSLVGLIYSMIDLCVIVYTPMLLFLSATNCDTCDCP